jgi:hypothetical protein
MHIPNLGLVEAAELPEKRIHVMSQQGIDFLKRAALSEEVGKAFLCDPHPSVLESLTIPEGEGAICINGLVSGVRGMTSNEPASRVMRAAMAEAEAAGLDLIDPEWYEKMTAPTKERGIRMSDMGLNPMEYGWTTFSHSYPKNKDVQRRAANGLIRFMDTKDPQDLFEVEQSLMADGGKSWSWQMSVPRAVYDGVEAGKYLREHPEDLKGAFHTTAQALFQPWNR